MRKLDSFSHSLFERTLTVTIVEYFGRVTIRPECELSRKFCRLLEQKTLTQYDIERIKELGYVIKQKEIVL